MTFHLTVRALSFSLGGHLRVDRSEAHDFRMKQVSSMAKSPPPPELLDPPNPPWCGPDSSSLLMWPHCRCLPLAHLANSQVVGFIFCSFDGETQSLPRPQPVPAGESLTGTVAPERGHGSPPILCYHHPSRFTLTVTEPPSLSMDPIPTLSTTRYCGAEAPPPPRNLTFQLYHRRLSPESLPNLNGTRSGWSSAWIQRLTTSFVGFCNIYTLTRPVGHHRSPLAAAGTIIAGKDSLQKFVVNNNTSVN
ncbi:unnamed protein product [Arabis nemorensis]|uniref:Uncharacterized protein n=1 Tax=Arabis nemorensis TaxID=586526 RepID=A0A565BQQ9_9BRAS|nr:unnamed protein product [Arabis nemorensis]